VTSRPETPSGRSPRTKALLLAGGLGTRLLPLTATTPKCLVKIAGKPLIEYWLDALERASVLDVLVNTHHLHEQVRDYLAEVSRRGPLRVGEAYEPKLRGSAGTVHENRAFADDADEILIVYADNLSNVSLERVLEFHRSHRDPMTMMLFHTPYPKQCGIAELDPAGKILSFVEKPAEPKSDLANAGLYVVDADAYREIADRNVFDFGFDIIPTFVGRMSGFDFEGYHRDIGNLDALSQAELDAPKVFGAG
jgi:mannose-1-phosphate guanylyltransferase